MYSMDIKMKIIEQYQKGVLQATISKHFGVNKSIVSRMIQRQPRRTTYREDKLIRQCKIKSSLDSNLSTRTIGRRLVEDQRENLKQKAARIRFSKEHASWSVQQRKTALFSDESKSNLCSTNGICYVRRPTGESLNPRYCQQTVKHKGDGVMRWGCFSGKGVSPLHSINDIMDRFVYQNILQDVMLPFAEWNMPLRWHFQHDNDPKHTTRVVKGWLT
ncbi:putative transmembrane receptor protein tyrosine kinase [Trypoxylus dichotomus]